MATAKRKALIVSMSCQPPGGAPSVGAWMLHTLETEYELGLLTWKPFEARPVDEYFGTALSAMRIETFCPPAWLRRAVECAPVRPLVSLQFAILMRMCHRLSSRFDVLISAQSEMDLGRRGIQYVHFPFAVDDMYHWASQKNVWYRALLGPYRAFCRWLCAFDDERQWSNVTLANSAFTAAACRRARPQTLPRVVHPPVFMPRLQRPWAQRADGFVCLGRVHPAKRILEMIDIVEGLRRRGHDFSFHVVGEDDGSAYYRRVTQCAAARPWVELHPRVSREQLPVLLSGMRYGLHGMVGEHFGIAVAEMVRAGLIVFAPREGGPAEILGGHDALLYTDVDDAIEKIDRVAQSEVLQRSLVAHLDLAGEAFDSERFGHVMRDIASAF